MTTTITNIHTHGNGCQSVEFTSVKFGTLLTIEGDIIDQRELPTGDLVLVHTEVDENENIIHEIYVRY